MVGVGAGGGGGLVAKSCPTLVTPWTIACQSPLSMGFSRQDHWSGSPFPSPGLVLTMTLFDRDQPGFLCFFFSFFVCFLNINLFILIGG